MIEGLPASELDAIYTCTHCGKCGCSITHEKHSQQIADLVADNTRLLGDLSKQREIVKRLRGMVSNDLSEALREFTEWAGSAE